jgi:hypothetical protein
MALFSRKLGPSLPIPTRWRANRNRATRSLDYRVNADDYFAKATDLARAGRIFLNRSEHATGLGVPVLMQLLNGHGVNP